MIACGSVALVELRMVAQGDGRIFSESPHCSGVTTLEEMDDVAAVTDLVIKHQGSCITRTERGS